MAWTFRDLRRDVPGSEQLFVLAIPQSEVLAKFLQEIGEKCGEILAKFFADVRPSISRENGRKRFHEKSSTFSTVHEIKFFHCCNSGGFGAQQLYARKLWPDFSFSKIIGPPPPNPRNLVNLAFRGYFPRKIQEKGIQPPEILVNPLLLS